MTSRSRSAHCTTSSPADGPGYAFVVADAGRGSHALERTGPFARRALGEDTQPLAVVPTGRTPRAARAVRIPARSAFNPVITVGRLSGNDVVFDEKSVSRYHAFLRDDDGRLTLHDAGSRNGTFVEGVRVAVGAGVPLAPGQRVSFGDLQVVFVVAE